MMITSFRAEALFCAKCGIQLSQFFVSTADAQVVQDECSFEECFSGLGTSCYGPPKGHAWRTQQGASETQEEVYDEFEQDAEPAGDMLNAADLTTNVIWTDDPVRMAGCCGPPWSERPEQSVRLWHRSWHAE